MDGWTNTDSTTSYRDKSHKCQVQATKSEIHSGYRDIDAIEAESDASGCDVRSVNTRSSDTIKISSRPAVRTYWLGRGTCGGGPYPVYDRLPPYEFEGECPGCL